jgi:hypothetical protein
MAFRDTLRGWLKRESGESDSQRGAEEESDDLARLEQKLDTQAGAGSYARLGNVDFEADQKAPKRDY